jgi:hypothetical protein
MKTRDYIIVFVSVFLCLWLFSCPGGSTPFGPSPNNQRPVLTAIVKLAKWLGWAFLMQDYPSDDPELPPERFTAMPPESLEANDAPSRVNIFGDPAELNHSTGW